MTTFSYAHAAVQEQSKLLGNLDAWIEKAIAFAKAKPFDPVVLLSARLAPDQFSLLRQVQSACDHAKFMSYRLAGKEPPKHPDTETTFEELRARIAMVRGLLDGFKKADFEGADSRVIELSFFEGKVLSGAEYLLEFAQPNFYFHLTTAYAILRHSGVAVGKMDYIGSLSLHDR
jgi:uncharacterized protein